MSAGELRRAAGQNLIEFALTFPIILLIVIGVIDLGRVVYSANALQNATREGARYAIVNACDDAGVSAAVVNRALAVEGVTVDPVVWGDELVEVSAQAEFAPITPLIGQFFPGGVVTLNSSSTMQRETWEQPDC